MLHCVLNKILSKTQNSHTFGEEGKMCGCFYLTNMGF
jgi:hypothetical protein